MPTSFLSPDGRQILDSRGGTDDGRLRALGWHAVDRGEVTKGAIEKSYNSWQDDAEAIGIGAMQGVPGLTGTVANLLPTDTAQKFAAEITNEGVAHPYLTTGAQLATGAGIIAATGGLGEAGLAATGAVGTSAFLQSAAFNAAGNVVIGAGSRFDARAINHALSPAGEEKMQAETGHEWLVDAAIGAAVPAVTGVAAKAFKGMAAIAEEVKNSQLQKSILDHVKLSDSQYAGRQSELWQMVEGNNWHNMDREEVSLAVKNRLATATTEMNSIKKAAVTPLSASEAGAYANVIGTHLASEPDLAQKIIAKGLNGLDVETLHGIRQDIASSIDWRQAAKDPTKQQGLQDGYEYTKGVINTLLQKNDPLLADSWMTVNKNYSDLATLQGVFKTGRAQAPVGNSFWKDLAMITGIGRMLGWTKAAIWAAQGKNAGNVLSKFQNGAFAESAGSMAKLFDKTAGRLAGALQKNFYGIAAAPGVIQNIQSTRQLDNNYDIIAASVAAATKDVGTASGRMMQAYTQAGAPDEIASRLVTQAVAKNSFLASKIPQPGGSDLGYIMPTTNAVSRQEQENFLRYYETIHDPVQFVENPTPQGFEAMQKFYPDMLQNTQTHLLQKIRSGDPLSLQQQTYATKVLQTPVSALTSPNTYRNMQSARQMVAQLQQQQQQQAQQASKGQGGSNSQPSNSDLTRSQQLGR
jgi:hypothetical protein